MTKQITSAFGEAKYPHLNQPDTEFNSDGIFQVKLLVNKEDAQKDIKIIDDVIKEQLIIEGKKQPNKTDQWRPLDIDGWMLAHAASERKGTVNYSRSPSARWNSSQQQKLKS